jgi:hypothetical protein
VTEIPQQTQVEQVASLTTAVCCLAIVFALVLGVGLASHLVLRHIVQTLPLLVCTVLGFCRSRLTLLLAFPSFLFWLGLMVIIWSYLLGISHFVSGSFSNVEIAMTIVVGAAAIAGIVICARSRSGLSFPAAAGLFLLMELFQWGCFRLSLLPAIAHR